MVLIIAIVVVLILVIRLVAGADDEVRIRKQIEKIGGTLVSAKWAPFAHGWLGQGDGRIYRLVYLDKDKNKHETLVRTSRFQKVYFNDDTIVDPIDKQNKHSQDNESLSVENAKLKKRIEALEQKEDSV